MKIEIKYQSSQELSNHTAYYTTILVDGKKEVSVNYSYGRVNVIYKNASHKAYRGFGKDFNSFEEALNNYKNASIIAAIKAAQELIESQINKAKDPVQTIVKNDFINTFGPAYKLPSLPLNIQLYIIQGSFDFTGMMAADILKEYYKILKILLL